MKEPAIVHRRISGANDIAWILAVFGVGTLVVAMLVGHLRTRFEVYRLANDRAELAAELRELQEQRRQLELEQQVRLDRIEAGEASDDFALRPLRPEQIYVVED